MNMIIEPNTHIFENKLSNENKINSDLISFWSDIRHIIFSYDTDIRESVEKIYS